MNILTSALLFLGVFLGVCFSSQLQVTHAIAGGPNVDVFVDGQRVLDNVPYGTSSDYLDAPSSNNVRIVIRPAGESSDLISATVDLRNSEYYTAVAAGLLSDTNNFPLTALLFEDFEDSFVNNGEVEIRFVHSSAGSPNVDVYFDGDRVFDNVEYTETGSPTYVNVQSTSYEVAVTVAGESLANAVVGPLTVNFNQNRVYTIFAIGIPGDSTNPLTALVSEDRNADDEDFINNSSSTAIKFSMFLGLFALLACVC